MSSSEADEGLRAAPGVMVATGNLVFWKENSTFANSEGAFLEQEIVESGGGIEALAVNPESGEVQKRSYPNAFGRDQRREGWESILALDLPGNAPRLGEEAVALLSAEQCPSGTTTVILGATQLALQVHESCGHPIELDRVFGTEASYAGTSFLTPEKLGSFRYGSDIVNITADATIPGGLGTFGWDDEGVPAQRTPIVRNGIFVGYLTSRETAQQLREILGNGTPETSGGAMRADGWNRIPLIRMTNINLEPGSWEFDDLVADTDEGIYMELNRSWSIDDKRLNFQFGTEIAYEIKRRQDGPHAQKRHLYRHHSPILGQLRRYLQRQPLEGLGYAQLRQRPAQPVRARRPWNRSRPLPQRPGRGIVNCQSPALAAKTARATGFPGGNYARTRTNQRNNRRHPGPFHRRPDRGGGRGR